ncbi:Protein of unknown function [Cotesia congregata]|uniref:Uncharacterized protein n=1 Tax=Cotesia congregata TaxID=51543 RepID=A0A8J2ENM6_COTCN|nr:Protein of unknown function [Cotesia congregata]
MGTAKSKTKLTMDNGKKPLSTERTAVYKRNKRRVLRYLKAFPPGTPGPIPKLYLESPRPPFSIKKIFLSI